MDTFSDPLTGRIEEGRVPRDGVGQPEIGSEGNALMVYEETGRGGTSEGGSTHHIYVGKTAGRGIDGQPAPEISPYIERGQRKDQPDHGARAPDA